MCCNRSSNKTCDAFRPTETQSREQAKNQAKSTVFVLMRIFRGVAKFGIALGSGPRGPGFESRHSDQKNRSIACYAAVLFIEEQKNPGSPMSSRRNRLRLAPFPADRKSRRKLRSLCRCSFQNQSRFAGLRFCFLTEERVVSTRGLLITEIKVCQTVSLYATYLPVLFCSSCL